MTTARYIELRPLRLDTVPADQVEVGADGRERYDGVPVTCRDDVCTYYRSAGVRHAVVMAQNVGFTAWGFGVRGLSATAQVRGRTAAAGDFRWPRSDDPFDVLAAYVELARSDYRLRLGRQRTLSGLGFASYDGASALVRPLPWLGVEAFGGRSLARGLEEPRHTALAGVESFLPDQNAWIVGAGLDADLAGTTAALRYQREIWRDRSALVSERAGLDVVSRRFRPVVLDGSLDYDFAFGRIGRAHLGARLPIERMRLTLELTGRRYVPYFELWTIWGYFDPVAYHEAAARIGWTPHDRAGLWLLVGLRRYDDTETTTVFGGLEDDAVRLDAGATLRVSDALSLAGGYRLNTGFGAYLGSGDLSVRWDPRESLRLDVHGTAFQNISEFRVGDGVVVGGGGGFEISIRPRMRLDGGVDVYRQIFADRPAVTDWNQLRAYAGLEIGFGDDPGAARSGAR